MATVSKNIFWSTSTSIAQLYTGSAVFIILAKLMSVENFGILSFGFSLSALAVIVSDFGFSLMIMKDYPNQQKNPGSYIFNSIIAKGLVSFGAGIFFSIYLLVFYNQDWLHVGLLFIAFAITASFTIYFQALLRVQNQFREYAGTTFVYAIAVTLIILAYWQLNLGLLLLVTCLVLAKVAQLVSTYFMCNKVFSEFQYNSKTVSKLLKNSWSFGVFSVLGIFYFMVDTQIISLYLGAEEVALYQAVFRIVLILALLSDIVSSVLLPYLSFKMAQRENVSELVSKIFFYLLLIGCSLFLFFTTLKIELLELLYTPEYAKASVLVLPFAIVLVLRTVSSLLGNVLTVSNKQEYRVYTVGASLVVSLALNLTLIPQYGIIAGAWTSVIVHMVLFGMYYYYSNKELPKLSLLSPTNLFLVLIAACCYLIIHYFLPGNLWVVFTCTLSWLVFVIIVMKQDDNLEFLLKILKEKGAG